MCCFCCPALCTAYRTSIPPPHLLLYKRCSLPFPSSSPVRPPLQHQRPPDDGAPVHNREQGGDQELWCSHGRWARGRMRFLVQRTGMGVVAGGRAGGRWSLIPILLVQAACPPLTASAAPSLCRHLLHGLHRSGHEGQRLERAEQGGRQGRRQDRAVSLLLLQASICISLLFPPRACSSSR